MQRRQLLWGLGAVTLGLGSGGCSLFADPQRLRIIGLSGSMPSKAINQFEQQFNKKTEYTATKTPPELWRSLQEFNQSEEPEKIPDVMGLSDGWLDAAIAQSLIRPFEAPDLAQIPQWQQLEPPWKALVTRNNKVWGIPYRWGTTVIAYRTDKVPFEITSWADLWRPELKRRLSLPDDAREAIGLTLKKLGKSYQTTDLNAIAGLATELKYLNAQARFYSSDTYLQPLMIDDTWAAVGWSQDIRRTQQQEPHIKVVIPKEGTALWCDLWVLPKHKTSQPARPQNLISAQQWINFCLQPEIAAQITALTDATATIPALDKLPASVKANPVKFPQVQAIANSEVLLPLPPETKQQYEQLWQKMRSNN
jgi:putative spermidine/putrescine transport system substrate-binding protein